MSRRGDANRLLRLQAKLRSLWHSECVALHRCERCRFAFPVPYVGGDAEFYNLAYGDPVYPRRRWEFDRTLRELRSQGSLLECGAGDGHFLRRLGIGWRPLALEYSDGAIKRLTSRGLASRRESVVDLAAEAAMAGTFDAICLFQVLEHLAPVDGVFSALKRLLAPGGSIFISVPNGPAIDEQEKYTGFLDMPPNHVGRWYPQCFDVVAERHGLTVAQIETSPPRRLATAWLYSLYRSRRRAYSSTGVDAVIAGVGSRRLRGLVRRLRAVPDLPTLTMKETSGQELWVHLTPVA